MTLSLLDNDLYKFTMIQAVWLTHRDAQVSYKFINRRKVDRFSEQAIERIRSQVAELGHLRLTEEECPSLNALLSE